MAHQYLGAAAKLIDVYLGDGPIDPELQVRFPSALDWLRTEDVIRLVGVRASRQEFYRRWATREDFLPDAVVYALLREYEADDPRQYIQQLSSIPHTNTPVSRRVIMAADGLLAALVRHPRSYLMLHIGPLLPQHPGLLERIGTRSACGDQDVGRCLSRLVSGLDLVMRPEWSTKRICLVLQAMLDGFILRYRLQPNDYPASRWAGASIFADAIIAFIVGAIDWDLTGQPGRAALDTLARPVTVSRARSLW